MSKPLLHCSAIPSAAQAALICAGYDTVDDLTGASAETLAKDLGISSGDAQSLISAAQAPRVMPTSQSVAALARTDVFPCRYAVVNKMLGGGLPQGYILEISGPPGSFKESLACDFVRTFVAADKPVAFVDMQNMTSPHALSSVLQSTSMNEAAVYYERVHTLPGLIVFLHSLVRNDHIKTGLVVLNSISFVFQSHPNLSPSRRDVLLGNIRQILLEACVTKNLAVIVTSQMATRILNADGSSANFETGVKAIMVPKLGPNYLPTGRSFRIVIAPHSRKTGVIQLVAAPPAHQPQDASWQEPYVLEDAEQPLQHGGRPALWG